MKYDKIPTTIFHDLEKLQRGFIWGDKKMTHKTHLISWEVCCMPKDQGDLGIKLTQLINDDFMFKIIWNLLNNPNDLWCHVLINK